MTTVRSHTVLVVDDDPVVRRVVALQVEQLGHRALEANSGRQALALLAEQPVDAVLLDVIMPDMSGLDVLHRIKADRRTESLPVLIMTGLADQDLRLSALGLGAEELLSKPVDRLELGARLRNILKLKTLVDLLAKQSGGNGAGSSLGEQDRLDASSWRALQQALPVPNDTAPVPRVLRLDADGRMATPDGRGHHLSELAADRQGRDRLVSALAALRQGGTQQVEVTLANLGHCQVRLAPVLVPAGLGERRAATVAIILPMTGRG
ncbi:MAG: response regulator [Deltaproteobacteria bacterium]|nr:response regulator [Deltaproteobacteria bacterium]